MNERGFISLVVLFILLFIAGLTLSMGIFTDQSLKIFAEEAKGLNLKNAANNDVWFGEKRCHRRICRHKVAVERGSSEIKRQLFSLCSNYSSDFGSGSISGGENAPDAYPLFNYAEFFSKTDHCRLGADDPPPYLTPAALRSALTCDLGSLEYIAGHEIIAGNITADRVIFIGSGSEGSNILAAKGYIDIDEVHLGTSVLIVAAGDVHINKLSVELTTFPKVTIISASGMVNIEDVEGMARYFIIAWAGSSLPAGMTLLHNSKRPSTIEWIPYMLTNRDAIF